ncbi:ANTAR domain-containing protein [Streptomyces sp. NPDC048481]|uniref:ANTAR domain-containing protein n=1 Tax=Streptomyces sp. NPDC048481 TaxID=3365557 RepID=UPI00371F17C7
MSLMKGVPAVRPQRVQRSMPAGGRDEELARLEEENAQLRRAVDSHAAVDQAIGVLVAVRKIPPTAGFAVLREVSQRANVKLHTVADAVIAWALGETLPQPVKEAFEVVLRRSRLSDGTAPPR